MPERALAAIEGGEGAKSFAPLTLRCLMAAKDQRLYFGPPRRCQILYPGQPLPMLRFNLVYCYGSTSLFDKLTLQVVRIPLHINSYTFDSRFPNTV